MLLLDGHARTHNCVNITGQVVGWREGGQGTFCKHSGFGSRTRHCDDFALYGKQRWVVTETAFCSLAVLSSNEWRSIKDFGGGNMSE